MTARSVRIVCPECRVELQVNQQALGRKMRCPQCDALITAAEPPPEPPPAAPPVVRWTTSAEPTPPPLPPPPDAVVIDGALPGVKKKASRAFVEADMDMTPMVDVVFQLLIFFMLTAAFTITKSQQFPKPQQTEPAVRPAQPEDDPDFVIIRIDNGNTFHISGGDLADEEEAASPVELQIKLKQARQGLSGKIPTKLLVKAHGDCTHERVVAAIDAGNDVGIEEVKVQTIEDEE